VNSLRRFAFASAGVSHRACAFTAHLLAAFVGIAFCGGAAELPDLSSIAPDLVTPTMIEAAPAAGLRVRQQLPGWEKSAVHHTLYLPQNWSPARKFPVIFEYPGNGSYSNRFGDVSTGVPERCNLGYGMSGGTNFIWVCLPFVAVTNGHASIATRWWGDVDATINYATNAVRFISERFGGDTNALILAGFSRGAIAGNFIGLHDERIAPLWRAFVLHSHYDGVRTWPYADSDRAAALVRLKRLGNRPQFVSHEGTIEATEAYLRATGVAGNFTFVPLPFRNHSDAWVLRDVPERRKLRAWLEGVLPR
jgi:acetyl esterase/lipase